MSKPKHNCVNHGDKSLAFFNNSKMNWAIYDRLVSQNQNNNFRDFRTLRLRLAFFLMAITHAKISEILMLKVDNLRTLEKKHFIKINRKTIAIKTIHDVKLIDARKDDLKYLLRMKYKNDYIFTKEIDGKEPLRRETFTRLVNNELKLVGDGLNPPRKLTSRSFQNWEED